MNIVNSQDLDFFLYNDARKYCAEVFSKNVFSEK